MSDDLDSIFDEVSSGKEQASPPKEKPKKKKPVKKKKVEAKKETPSTDDSMDDFFGDKEPVAKEKEKPETEVIVEELSNTEPAEGMDDFFDDSPKDTSIVGDVDPPLIDEEKDGLANEVMITKTKIPYAESDEEFDISPEVPSEQQTFMIAGKKGNGKSYLGMSFEGNIAVISFDRKSSKVWLKDYNQDPRITVYDGIRYIKKKTADAWVQSSEETLRYLHVLIEQIRKEGKTDYIMIDSSQILIQICEKVMKYHNKLKAFQPFKWNLWGERNMYFDSIWAECLRAANKGVIYTAFVNTVDCKIENGVIIEKYREPKWASDLETQVDTVIFIDSEWTEDGMVFWATVDSSKTPEIWTGLKVDVTGSGISKVIEASKEKIKASKKKKV